LLRLLYEKTIIPDVNQLNLLGKISMQEFLRRGVLESYPFIAQYFDEQEFQEFYLKLCMVQRELIYKSLRNPSR